MYDAGLRYEDLVGAVDVVITKPGYGIISDCVANGTAMLYTPRGRFAEYEVMVREMPRLLRCRCTRISRTFADRRMERTDSDELCGCFRRRPSEPPTRWRPRVGGER